MTSVDPDLQPVPDELIPMRPRVSIPIPETVPEEEPEPNTTDGISTEFDPRYREPFIGLLYLGHLRKRVVRFGHSFNLKTPSQRERLEAGILHKKYANTLASEQAWATLVVSLYLESVDDQSLPDPIGPAVETKIEDRFKWVLDNIKPELIGALFDEVLLLDAEVVAALNELDSLAKA